MSRPPRPPRYMTPLEKENRELQERVELQRTQAKAIREYEVMFNNYLNSRRDHFHPPNIVFWSKFVEYFYDTNAVETWCFRNCENIQFCKKPSMDKRKFRFCNICGSISPNTFDTDTESMPGVFLSTYGTGLISDVIEFDTAREEFLPDGTFLFEDHNSNRQMRYKDFNVVFNGTIRIIYSKNKPQILSLEFCAKAVQLKIPYYQIPHYLVPALPPTRYIEVTVQKLFERYAAVRRLDISSHIDSIGLPQSYRRHFMRLEEYMKDTSNISNPNLRLLNCEQQLQQLQQLDLASINNRGE
ncbi:hypothetical protein ABFS82_02G157500 [Erythranthe guttata]